LIVLSCLDDRNRRRPESGKPQDSQDGNARSTYRLRSAGSD